MQYSFFASIMTFGGMIGALISGKVAEFFGRRVVCLFSFTKFIELSLTKPESTFEFLI